MTELIAYQGLPGSGKTTKALEHISVYAKGTAIRVNRDDLRAMQGNQKFSKQREKAVAELRDAMILSALSQGKTVISDDTNLSPKTVDRLRALAEQAGAKFTVDSELLSVPIQTCVKRDSLRAKTVGVQVILDMHLQYIAAPLLDVSLPESIIVDIDGTLAHANNRSVYDLTKVGTDTPDKAIVKLVQEQSKLGKMIIVMTGRSMVCRDDTLRWLRDMVGLEDFEYKFYLLMRETGDLRKDWQVKTDLYNKYVLGNYAVDFVLDDRDSVVLTWRSLRLKCLQVGYGDF